MKSKRIPPDPLMIFTHGERFLRADVYLRSNGDPIHMNAIGIPSLVLSAVASELFLKSLLAIETGSFPPTHHLKAIFRQLKPNTKKRIREFWDQLMETPQEKKISEAIFKHTGEVMPKDLEWALDTGSNGFERLRYAYEHDHEGSSFNLCDPPKIVKRVILEIKPEWKHLDLTPPTKLDR